MSSQYGFAMSSAKKVLLSFLVLCPLAGRAPLRAAEPFYLSLMREGEAAYLRGDHVSASRDLRIACFGLLEEPPLLGECLVKLALAQAGGGDRDGFQETFRRLLEAEDLVGAYRRAALSEELRGELEARAATLVPEAVLASRPDFRHVVEQQRLARLARLAPREARSELARLMAEEPGESRWPLMLAGLELEEDRSEAALAALERLPEEALVADEVRCLRGRARAESRQWQPAAEDLAACSATATDPRMAVALLRCRVELEQWEEGARLLASLAPAIRGRGDVGRLARKIERNAAPSEPVVAEAEVAAGPELERPSVVADVTPDQSSAPPASQGPAAAGGLEEVRRAVEKSQTSADMRAALRLARELADENAADREAQFLAAEIAYRLSLWSEALRYFARGGDPGLDQPERLFYMAVCLYETGNLEEAARALNRCLPRIKRTPFVESYAEKIFHGGSSPS